AAAARWRSPSRPASIRPTSWRRACRICSSAISPTSIASWRAWSTVARDHVARLSVATSAGCRGVDRRAHVPGARARAGGAAGWGRIARRAAAPRAAGDGGRDRAGGGDGALQRDLARATRPGATERRGAVAGGQVYARARPGGDRPAARVRAGAAPGARRGRRRRPAPGALGDRADGPDRAAARGGDHLPRARRLARLIGRPSGQPPGRARSETGDLDPGVLQLVAPVDRSEDRGDALERAGVAERADVDRAKPHRAAQLADGPLGGGVAA